MRIGSKMGQRLRRVAGLLALGFLAMAAGGARADDYPSRPVTIIVPFAPGGSADVYARILAQKLQVALGHPFIVDDRPGASSIIGSNAVAMSAPDGYTLLLISNTHTVNETLFRKKPFKLTTDFVPVAPINSSDLVLVARPGLPVNNLADLIKLAKAKPNGVSFASSGAGTPYHMAGELFKQMAGISILHVPYRSSSAARIDVLSGQVDMMFDATTTMVAFIESGKAKALATTGKTRSAVLPNVPTMTESGVPGYEAVIWLGLVAPKNTPPAIVDKLNAEITKIEQDPATRAAWAKDGAIPVTMTPAAFGQFIEGDIKKWAEVVKVSGARADR